MKIPKGLFFSVFYLLICYSSSIAQQQKYIIFWGDDEIGAMSVSRVMQGNRTDYSFNAEVEFRVILKYERNTKFKASYRNDTLIYCSSRSVMNDNLKEYQWTRYNGKHYDIFKHPSDSSTYNKLIKESVALLYYSEPKAGTDSIYAEGNSKFCQLETLSPGTYKLHIDDDKKNIYRYKNGILREVEVDRTWFDLVFRRIDSSD